MRSEVCFTAACPPWLCISYSWKAAIIHMAEGQLSKGLPSASQLIWYICHLLSIVLIDGLLTTVWWLQLYSSFFLLVSCTGRILVCETAWYTGRLLLDYRHFLFLTWNLLDLIDLIVIDFRSKRYNWPTGWAREQFLFSLYRFCSWSVFSAQTLGREYVAVDLQLASKVGGSLFQKGIATFLWFLWHVKHPG